MGEEWQLALSICVTTYIPQ